jgi:heme a synthase
MDWKRGRVFRFFGISTIILTYLVILAGGIVRSTGSGMGCPDWPKCFGTWIPPESETELPADYKEKFKENRIQKNLKLSRYLISLGFTDLAAAVSEERPSGIDLAFNAEKTRIEYLNRVLGVLVGISVFITALLSLRFYKERKAITILSFLSFILVGIQGWIGSVVVSTDLLPWMVTVHMILAIVILLLLQYTVNISSYKSEDRDQSPGYLTLLIWVCILFTGIQIVFGTQVREMIDNIATRYLFTLREEWISNLGMQFYIHRSFSILLFFLNGILFWTVYKNYRKVGSLYALVLTLQALILAEILTGVGMVYFGIPAFLQPVHLVLGCAIISQQFVIWLKVKEVKLQSFATSKNAA